MTPEEKLAKRKAYLAAWREKNRDKTRAAQQRYYAANKETCDARVKAVHTKNRPQYSQRTAEWRAKNHTHVLALRRARYADDPGKDILRVRVRQKRVQSVPPWLTQAHLAEIQGIYRFCKVFKGFEVDHIIPLNGARVSGLHTPANLQVLTVRENRRKGATFTENING